MPFSFELAIAWFHDLSLCLKTIVKAIAHRSTTLLNNYNYIWWCADVGNSVLPQLDRRNLDTMAIIASRFSCCCRTLEKVSVCQQTSRAHNDCAILVQCDPFFGQAVSSFTGAWVSWESSPALWPRLLGSGLVLYMVKVGHVVEELTG